ncbi:uncharacterized protein G2W53_041747 [Senna tora]|uniref:Uncharacterized protein n=1 Tax=Senna tora TaxID=362788 RepID=A0A834SFK8_9FABA|nr:uncharacterized protein G2W53_041747 [Senna tora]
MLQLELSWHGRSVDHVLTYFGRQIAVGSHKRSRITRQKTCCASVPNTSVRVVFANHSGFDAPIPVVLAWEERGSRLNIFRTTNRSRISETLTNYEGKVLLRKSVDHVLTYSGRQIAVGSQKASQIMRQKTCCASESNTSVRVVLANRSGFDAPIGVVLAWEERGSFLNIFRTTNHSWISETFLNYEAKDSLRNESNTSVRVVFSNRSGFDAPVAVVLAWEERGSCINIFWTTNRGRISENFTNYEAKHLLRNVDHVLTYSGREITVGSQKPSGITRQNTCCASESNMSVRVVFVNRSGFDAPVGVVLAWEEPGSSNRSGFDAPIAVVMAWEARGSCLNLFRTKNRGRISETFTNYEAKDSLRKSVDHVLTYSGRQIAVGSQKHSRITRQKTRCASESNTSVRVVFANRSGCDAPIGVVLAWEERGSCLNIFRTKNSGRISETFTNYEAKALLRKSVDHVLTYSGRQIAVGSQKPSRITRQRTSSASESNTSVRVVFANRSGFDAPIGVVLAWEERGSCLNIFQKTNCVVLAWEERGSCLNIFRTTSHGRITGTFMNYMEKDLLRKKLHELRGKTLVVQVSQTCQFTLYLRTGVVLMLQLALSWHGRSVDHVLTYAGREIAVGSQKPSRITRPKTCCASESNTSVRVVFANRSGFDAPIGVVLAWEERGSCLNIFQTTNRGRISETFTNYEAKDLLLVMAWEECGSCLNILRTTNHGRISETFTNYEAKYLLRKSVDHVLTYCGRQITVGSQKPSRIMRQNTCCASESNMSVRIVFAKRIGFDAPVGVVLASEERGSCLNVFRTTNRGWISKTFTNYEAKDMLHKQKTCCATESNTAVRVVFSNRSGFDAPIGVVLAWEERGESNTSVRVVFLNQSGFDAPIAVFMAWEERGSCLNIFQTTNRCRISETLTNYEAKFFLRKSVDHVLVYSGRKITVGSQKPSRITRQKTCCASESNTSVRVVFTNRSGFDAPIVVVMAWEERGSCLNIFRTTNGSRISETFMNYEAKTCCPCESNTSVRVVFANRSGFDAPIGVVLAWEERGSCLNIFWTTNRGWILETFTNYETKTFCASESNTSVRVVFANRSGFDSPIAVVLARESNTSVCVVFANRNSFDAPIAVVMAWEARGSCPNIFRMTNRGRISETFMNYKAKDLLRKSVHHVLTYSGRQIAVGTQKPSRITRQNTCCASESNTSVRVVFANQSGFDAPIGVVLAWDERGSCLNIFLVLAREERGSCLNILRMTNRGRISETFMNYEAKYLLPMSVNHVLTYSAQQIAVESQKPSRITRQNTRCASESNTSVRAVFANLIGFDATIGVVLAWEERGSCLNIFRMTNRVVMAWEERGSCLNIFPTIIAVGSQKPSRITRQKTCCASESNTSVRVVFANRSGFDAQIAVVLAWEERGSCLNIFRTTNHGRTSETFTNYEAKDLMRNRFGMGGAWIMSEHIPDDKSRSDLRNLHELLGKRLVAQVSQTRRFALYLRTGVVLMVQLESSSHGRLVAQVNQTRRFALYFRTGVVLTLQLESSWHGRSVDNVLTYFGRQIAIGYQKPSRITKQKTCCASESNTSVPVLFANWSGFDGPIGVVLAWEERGSCLNIFRTTNCARISETFTNYEAKYLLRNESNTSVRVVFANRSGFDAPIGVFMAWEERGSCLNIFRTTNHGRISETFTNYEVKDLLHKSVDHVLTFSGREIAVGSQKPSRITRQKTCCASESNTSVCVVFANRSGFDAPIGVVLAWEERGSCLNIFWMTNRGWISETFTNYVGKDLLRK